MNLLDRYVNEVGKHLPRKNRADIESEIRSTLQDMLEDRSQKTGQPIDDPMIMAVLKEYGAPQAVAATYQPEHYLIGPKLYPLFTLVLKIVFIVLTVLTAIQLGIRLGNGADLSAAGAILLDYAQGLMAALGNIVFVFAVLERFLPAKDLEMEDRWDPADLLKEPDEGEVHLWEPVVSILVGFAGLIVLNFYPQIISLTFNPFTSSARNIPLLSETFFSYLPWINLAIVLEMILNIALLRLGHKTVWTRAGSIGSNVLDLVIAAMMLKGPSIIGLTPQALAEWNIQTMPAETLVNLVNGAVDVALVIAIIANAADIAKELYHIILRPGREARLRIQ